MKSFKSFIIEVTSGEGEDFLNQLKSSLKNIDGVNGVVKKTANSYIINVSGDRLGLIQKIAKTLKGATYNPNGAGSSIGRIEMKASDGSNKRILLKGGTVNIANKGDLAEGLISAGIFAKFTKRTPDGIKDITRKDIEQVLKKINSKGFLEVVNDLFPEVQDTIRLQLSLPQKAMADLLDSSKWSMFSELFDSSVSYGNSKNVMRYAKFLFRNSKPNIIEVKGVGTENQTGTKVDIITTIDGVSTNLNISLKVTGGNQFGQVGGHSFEKLYKFFDVFGAKLSKSIEKTYNEKLLSSDKPVDAVWWIYEKAEKELKKIFKGDDDTKELKYLKDFANGIEYYATLNDPSVEMVYFDKGSFKSMKFNKVEEKLANVDLDCKLSGKSFPQIIVYDKKTNSELIQLRCKGENQRNGMYFRNYVEKKSGFSKIFGVER